MSMTSVTGLSSSRSIICGHYDACTRGRYNVCPSVGFVCLSCFGGRILAVCRRGASWDPPTRRPGTDVGALVERLAIVHHAVRLSGIKPNHSALVFGAGPIGLMTTAALRACGWSRSSWWNGATCASKWHRSPAPNT